MASAASEPEHFAACSPRPSAAIPRSSSATEPTAKARNSATALNTGYTEADDAAAAIEYAMGHGARQIVLFGWSMGAAIALQLAHNPSYRRSIAGLVLDSPVLDWTEVIKANCTRSGLPAAAGSLAIPWLTLRPLAHMVGSCPSASRSDPLIDGSRRGTPTAPT